MLTHRGSRVFEIQKDQLGAEHVFITKRDGFSSYLFPEDQHVPDLSDPATLGCLLHLVRKAWGRPFWVEGDPRSMGERPDEWIGVLFEGRFATCSVVHAATEAEALVAALEVAP
jgi:hypothetical protein